MSLVEVLVGAVILVAFFGALMALVVRVGTERQAHVENSLALAAALDNLERIRSLPQSGIAALDGADFDVLGANGGAGGLHAVPGDPDGLPGEIAVTIDQSVAGATLYRVTAGVHWRGVTRDRELRLEALIGERK